MKDEFGVLKKKIST
jgi:hypothetical protein